MNEALLLALGLPKTATEADVLSAVTALKATPAAIPAALSAALNLSGTAGPIDEAAALAAVAALKAKPATPPTPAADATTLQTMQALQQQVAALSAAATAQTVQAQVDGAITAGKLLPAQRDWAIGLGTKDAAMLAGYLASAPTITGLAGQSGGTGPGGAGGAGGLQASALSGEVMRAMGLSAEQFAKAAPAA